MARDSYTHLPTDNGTSSSSASNNSGHATRSKARSSIRSSDAHVAPADSGSATVGIVTELMHRISALQAEFDEYKVEREEIEAELEEDIEGLKNQIFELEVHKTELASGIKSLKVCVWILLLN